MRSRAPYLPHALACLALVGCGGSEPTPEAEPVEPAEEVPAAAVPAARPVPRDGSLPPGTELPDPATLPDVVLITLDTTRADRLGSYGYDLAETDALDALAARGRRYERAYSPLPLTIPSHATMFTGLYPPSHGIRANADQILGDEFVTLAERLKAVGYRTGASIAAFVTTRRFGLHQGFDVYFDNIDVGRDQWHSERPANEVIDDILAWDAMEDPSGPRFAWVHLYDAHFPYVLHRKGDFEKKETRPYDKELAWVDDQVERLLKGFDQRPTLVMVVGDHGEGLGDHHELAHGMMVYDSTQRVPFIMAGPGVPEGEVVSTPVSLADVAPILLEQLGLPGLADAEGVAVRDASSPPIYMEAYEIAHRFSLAPPVAVVDGNLKYIHLPKPELYDVVADPKEENNLAEQRPDDVSRLHDAFLGLGFAPPSADAGLGMPGTDLRDQLELLGYVTGDEDFDPDEIDKLPDPKDHVELLQKSQRADRVARRKDFTEQAKVLAELVESYPDVIEFRARLVQAQLKADLVAAAETTIDEALQRFPANERLTMQKGAVLAAERRFREASLLFQEVAQQESSHGDRARVMAVQSLMQAGAVSEAQVLGERYLAAYPDDFSLAGLLGVSYVHAGDPIRAIPYLEKGILADVPEREVAYQLAAAATGRGDRGGAIDLLRVEVRNHPGNFRAMAALGRLLLADKHPEEVLNLVVPTLQRHPEVPDLYFLKAQAQFNLQRFEAARKTVDEAKELKGEPQADLLMLEANLLQQEGKPDVAKAAYEKAIAQRAKEKERQSPRVPVTPPIDVPTPPAP